MRRVTLYVSLCHDYDDTCQTAWSMPVYKCVRLLEARSWRGTCLSSTTSAKSGGATEGEKERAMANDERMAGRGDGHGRWELVLVEHAAVPARVWRKEKNS